MTEDKKETTARTTSVGADEGQSDIDSMNNIPHYPDDYKSASDEMDALLRQFAVMSAPGYLPVITMRELYQTVYAGRQPIVDGLLYSGVYILAGAPKIGKSFLVAQIAYHVSTGHSLWGFGVHCGPVLYLALEDDYQRLQTRLYRMFGIHDTDSLYLSINAGQIGLGLDEQLERFINEHQDTKLIVIDTLQRARDCNIEGYSYANDYDVIGRAKKFADRHNVCVLIVHHTRKQPAIDNFEMISGTTGLLGCADGALLMQKEKRTDLEATLDIVGRDQMDQRLYLSKDVDTLLWTLERTEMELWREPPDPVLEQISNLFSTVDSAWSGSPTELVTTLGLDISPITLTKHLNVHAGRLKNEYGIQYQHRVTHAGRRICLTYSKDKVI